MTLLSDLFGGKPLILNEKANYGDMFNDMSRILGHRPPAVDAAVAEASSMLRKADRILWYLRLWKIGYLDKFLKHCDVARREVPSGWAEKVVSDYAHRARISEADVRTQGWQVFNDRQLMTNIQHYLSLGIRNIDNTTFGTESVDDLLGRFKDDEDNWKKQARGAFADDDAIPVIKFPNGLAWHDLQRHKCETEGKAMGHCGNAAAGRVGETLLSLRKTFNRGDAVLHKPLLTFVLDADGMLGEMKGRFNEKPEQKYHNEIVALLKSDIVCGIKGGGHKAHQNFSMHDLDEETRLELIEMKPELGSLQDFYDMFGIDDNRTMSKLRTSLESFNIDTPQLSLSDDKETFEIEQWQNLERFTRDVDDYVVNGLLDIVDGQSDMFEDIKQLTATQVSDILDHLSDPDYATVMRALGLKAIPHDDLRYVRAMQVATSRIMSSEYYDMLLEAARQSMNIPGNIRDDARSQIRRYIDCGWNFEGALQYVEIPEDWDDPVTLNIRVIDLIDIVSSDEDGGEDHMYAADIRHNGGWTTLDNSYMSERRERDGLSPMFGRDDIKTEPFVAGILETNETFNVHAAGKRFARNLATPVMDPSHPRLPDI